MTALAYEIAEHLGKFRTDSTTEEKKTGKEARYPVLSYLVLRANKRRRAFPSIDTIAKATGYGRQRVIDALAWLEKRGAISDVPRHLRIGNERNVHFNNAVYQLTGFIKLCGESIRYLHMGSDDQPETQDDLPIDPNLTIGTKNVPTATKQSVRKTNVDQYDKRELVSTTNEGASLYDRNHLNDSIERIKDTSAAEPPESIEIAAEQQPPIPDNHDGAGEQVNNRKGKSDLFFDTICRRGFKFDPYLLPDKKAGGRISAVKKAILDSYPDMTPERLNAIYSAYFKANPNVNSLRSKDKTIEAVTEYEQNGTIVSVLAKNPHTPSSAPPPFPRAGENVTPIPVVPIVVDRDAFNAKREAYRLQREAEVKAKRQAQGGSHNG